MKVHYGHRIRILSSNSQKERKMLDSMWAIGVKGINIRFPLSSFLIWEIWKAIRIKLCLNPRKMNVDRCDNENHEPWAPSFPWNLLLHSGSEKEKIPWEGEFTRRRDPWAGLIASCGSFYIFVMPHKTRFPVCFFWLLAQRSGWIFNNKRLWSRPWQLCVKEEESRKLGLQRPGSLMPALEELWIQR